MGLPAVKGCAGTQPGSARPRQAVQGRVVVGRKRTGPGGVSAVSNRTVTTPAPEPHTQPGPSRVHDVRARRPRAALGVLGELHHLASSSSAVSRRRGPPASSRRARRPRRRATARRRSGVDLGRQPAREPGDRGRRPWGVGEGARPVVGGEVVEPDLDRHGPPGQPALRIRLPPRRPAGSPAPPAAAVGEVGVVGALHADRLGLALGDDRTVVLGPGERCSAVPCAWPSSRTSSSSPTASRSATVWMPTRRSRSAVAGPTPG